MSQLTPFELTKLPKGHQIQMAGEDWLSERDKKTQAKAEAARAKAALACSKKLEAAADALNEFTSACLDCADASAPRGADDGRRLLMQSMMEYASYLNGVYSK